MTVFSLVVRLGAMLGFAQMDEESVTLLLSHVHDFLRYSNSNEVFFVPLLMKAQVTIHDIVQILTVVH